MKAYRARLRADGLARFEVLSPDADRALIRTIAKRLVEPGPIAARLRADLVRLTQDDELTGAAIVSALRRSPLVGADITFERDQTPGRKIAF